ncbi:hypothetical protein QVD17_03699 [Tagetes erecta]|uniref:Maternal effect embryo arrest 22 n=1 Tax=Tagetes erecta TaxID=13708 RepID=A0AAD8P9X4_TARER|nr:hypothetical protein QVD17_03699 [Tagetes erecta]
MAGNFELKDESTTNSCCKLWEDRFLKLQQKVKKTEDARAALKKAVGIYESQFDRMQGESQKLKKAYEEEKLQTEHERKEKEKESAARVSMENEISELKAEILSLRQKQGSTSENASEELMLLKGRVLDKEMEINCLQEEINRAKAEKSRTEQGQSNLKTQLLNVETENKKLTQDLQKERARADSEKKRADEMLKNAKTQQAEVEAVKAEKNNNDLCLLKSEQQNLETEVGRLKELLEDERKRADCEAKKAKTEKKNAHKVKEMLKAEQSRADEALKTAKTKQAEIEALKAEKSNNDLCLKSDHQNLETEIGRLKELFQNERKRADCEAKKAEIEKENTRKVKELLKAEQSRADEQRKLVDIERKKAEEFAHQVQMSKCEADEAKSKLVSEGLKFKEANKKFEAEKKKSIKEKKKAEEQQKIAEMSTKHALEEKHNAVRLQQQLEDCQNKYDKLKKDMEIYEKNNRTPGQVKQKTNLTGNSSDLDMNEESEYKKAAEMYKLQAMKEKLRADKLVHQLEDTKKRATNEHKVIEDLVSSKSLTDTMKTKSTEMKLLKKRLKLEKARVKHFIQVAELEKKCKKTVEDELHRLKLEFARFSSRVGLCSYFDICNVGKSCMEKNDNVSLKRNCSRKELAEPTKPSEYSKPNLEISAPSLPISGTCTESTSGTASKMEPLRNRKKIDNFALVSSMASFSDRQLVVGTQENLQLPISRLSNENAEVADNNVKSPVKARNKDEKTKKRKRLLNAVESFEHLYTEGKTRHAKIAKNVSESHGMLVHNDKPLAIEHNKEEEIRTVENVDFNDLGETGNDDRENFLKMFDGDCMKLLSFDSEVEEEKYRAAFERPLSPTLPNIVFESSLIDLDDSRPSGSEIPAIAIESWSIVVFSENRDSESLSKIFRMTKTFSSHCRAFSQSGLVVKDVISTLSADQFLSPKEKVCAFFSLFLKSFSSIALTNLNHANYENFLSSIHIISGQLKKVLCDVETRTRFAKICDLEELITLIQNFLIDEEILVCNADTSSETLSLPHSKASLHELVVGAVLLASLCEAFDRVDFISEISYSISRITSSSTMTLLHVFAYVCGEKLLSGGDCNLIMTVVKSVVTYCERKKLSSGFPSCTKCPFSTGSVSMEELASLLLKKLSGCSKHMFGMTTYKLLTVPDDSLSDLGDVLSLLELLAAKMNWGWVCKNIVNELLKMLEACVMETPLTSIFVLLGQMARFGIDANGFQDAEVENIRVKLTSFISRSTSSKISLPVQFAAVNALLGTTPLSFQDICKNNLKRLPPVSSTTATDCIQRWFFLLSDEHKSLSVRLLSADAS